MKLHKIVAYLVLLVGAIGFILWLVMNNSINDLMKENGITEASDIAKDPTLFGIAEPMVTPIYSLLLIVFAIVLVVTLISIINSLASKPGAFKKVVIPAVIFLGIMFLGYMFAKGNNVDLQPFIDKGQDITEGTSKKVGAGLISFYVLIILAIASMMWSGVKKLFN